MNAALPLHPALVHLPLGIVVLLPIVTIVLSLLFWRKSIQKPAFILIALLHGILTISSYVAIETGEDEEKRVQKLVGKEVVHEHEEKAELFASSTLIPLILTLTLFIPAGIKLFQINLGVLFVMQIALVFLAYDVGHSGGELVYRHGAANAYLEPVETSESK